VNSGRYARVFPIRLQIRRLRRQIRRLPTRRRAEETRKGDNPRRRARQRHCEFVLPHVHNPPGNRIFDKDLIYHTVPTQPRIPPETQSNLHFLRATPPKPVGATRRRHRDRMVPLKVPIRRNRHSRIRTSRLLASRIQSLVG